MLPCETLNLISSFLEVGDFASMRSVISLKWNTLHIFKHNKNLLLQHLTKKRTFHKLCLLDKCSRKNISQLSYADDTYIQHVPWCFEHTPKDVLVDIEIFCFS